MIKCYKIRRTSDNLFSTGGSNPCFNKEGKIWSTLARLKSHIRQINNSKIYENCELVTFEYSEKETISMKNFMCSYYKSVLSNGKLNFYYKNKIQQELNILTDI